MKLLNKILNKSTKTSKKPEGECDICQITIWQGDKALCFHADNLGEEVFVCEGCIEKLYGEYVKELV